MKNQDVRLAILINPNAGYGKGVKVLKKIQHMMKTDPLLKNNITHIEYTNKKKNDPNLQKIIKDSNTILVCGGDGTIHQCINDLTRLSYDKAFSIFPLGTGNDLYSNLGAKESNIIHFIYKLLKKPKLLEVDLFSVNDSVYFINYISLGIDAYILRLYDSVCNNFKKFPFFRSHLLHLGYLKKLLFFFLGFSAFCFYRKKIRVIDHNKLSSVLPSCYTSIIIHNIKSYAGGSILNNNSLINDGKLEFACNASKKDFLKVILSRFGLFNFPFLSKTQNPPLNFNITPNVPIQVDGEDYSHFFHNCSSYTIQFKKRLNVHI